MIEWFQTDKETLFERLRNHNLNSQDQMSARQMHRSVFASIPLVWLVTFFFDCPLIPSTDAQTCGGDGVAVQVLGSGGPELQDKRASSSYLVWQDRQTLTHPLGKG